MMLIGKVVEALDGGQIKSSKNRTPRPTIVQSFKLGR